MSSFQPAFFLIMMFDYLYLGLKSHKIDENKELSKIM